MAGLYAIGEAAAAYAVRLTAQQRCDAAVARARAEVDELLAADGLENVRFLQRAIRDVMTAHAGVVRDETGIRAGLAELTALDARITQVSVHPDLAGFQDLAHAFDLKASALAAVATTAPTTRRSTRRCRSTTAGRGPAASRETPPPIPDEIAALMRDVSVVGKLVE